MRPRFCYWSVATGAYGAMMEHCVRTARRAGVFKEFHVLTDRPLAGCECYDALKCDLEGGLFKLHYLKVGMSRLNFEYFVWLDADTVFVRNPLDVLVPLSRAPIHVPLEVNLAEVPDDSVWPAGPKPSAESLPVCPPETPSPGATVRELRALGQELGLMNEPHLGSSAFWIVHHDAIDQVYELALRFWHGARERGVPVDVSTVLGFAMQLLCADPALHRLARFSDLWAGDHLGLFGSALPQGEPWPWRHPLAPEPVPVQPALVHVPRSRELLVRATPL